MKNMDFFLQNAASKYRFMYEISKRKQSVHFAIYNVTAAAAAAASYANFPKSIN